MMSDREKAITNIIKKTFEFNLDKIKLKKEYKELISKYYKLKVNMRFDFDSETKKNWGCFQDDKRKD